MYYSSVIKKRNAYCKKIEINSLIALCEIENYDIFCKELESLIASKKNKYLIKKMYLIMKGKFILGNKKYKNFVKKYQDIIEIMKKNNCLREMTISKYNMVGKINANSTEDYFFKFIVEHKENIETIKEIATKIKNLGFDNIIYGEKLKFTDIEYELDTSYGGDFEYLENIEIVSTYEKCPIKYRTNESCYSMTLNLICSGANKDISRYNREIELNSLIFEPSRLPNEITFESTVGTIKKLVEDSKKDYQIIRESVDFSISVEDLIEQYNLTKNIIESTVYTKNKEDLKQILHNISKELTKLKLMSLSHENETIDNLKNLDKNEIEDRKKLYLKR